MRRETIQRGLEFLVSTSPTGCHSVEASSLGIIRVPEEVEFQGVVYRYPCSQRDHEGEVFSTEYSNGKNLFTIWND